LRDSGGAYNQQQSRSYQSDESVWKYWIRNYVKRRKKLILKYYRRSQCLISLGIISMMDMVTNKTDRRKVSITICEVQYIQV
jgi:hypothetical protein